MNFATNMVAEATNDNAPVPASNTEQQPNQPAGAGLFGSNPFANLATQYKTITAM